MLDLTLPKADRSLKEQRLFWLARGIAIAASVVILTTLTLLFSTWFVTKREHLPDTRLMEALIQEAGNDHQNMALREHIRDLDLLTRKAYFESVALRKSGAIILMIAAIVLVTSLKLMSATANTRPTATFKNDDTREARSLATTAMLCFLAFLGGIVFVYSRNQARVFTSSDMNALTKQPGQKPASTNATDTKDPGATATLPLADESVAATYWPALRGWRNVGLSPASAKPPLQWDATKNENLLWKTKIPLPGFGSPVVWSNLVFVSGANADAQSIFAFNTEDGKLLWQHDAKLRDMPARELKVNDDTGYAAPTLACDSRHIYAIFATGDLVCCDHAGNRVWSRNYDVSRISYGYASSLLAYEGRVFVQCDLGHRGYVVALDDTTGVELWRKTRAEASSWSSPSIAIFNDKPMLLINGVNLVTAYAPDNGNVIWEAPGMSGEIAPSLTAGENIALVAMSNSGAKALSLADGSMLWESNDYDAPDIPSPVLGNGLAFILSNNGTLTCVAAATGDVKWSHEFDGTFNSSPLIINDLLLLTDLDGKSYVIKAAAKFETVATAQLGEACYATPAVVGSRLYFRGNDYLYCIGGTAP